MSLHVDIDWDSPAPRNLQGERCMALWAEVLRVGLVDAARAFPSYLSNPHMHYEPLDWLYSDELSTGSFVWICNLFGLDPSAVRSAARMKFRELGRTKDVPSERSERREAKARAALETELPHTEGLPDGVPYFPVDVGIDDDPVSGNEPHYLCAET